MYYIPEDEIKLVLRRALNRKPTIIEVRNFKLFLDRNRFVWLKNSAKDLFANPGLPAAILAEEL